MEAHPMFIPIVIGVIAVCFCCIIVCYSKSETVEQELKQEINDLRLELQRLKQKEYTISEDENIITPPHLIYDGEYDL